MTPPIRKLSDHSLSEYWLDYDLKGYLGSQDEGRHGMVGGVWFKKTI